MEPTLTANYLQHFFVEQSSHWLLLKSLYHTATSLLWPLSSVPRWPWWRAPTASTVIIYKLNKRMPFLNLISTSSLLWEGSWGLIHSSSVVSFPTSCKNKKVWEISYVKYFQMNIIKLISKVMDFIMEV